MDRLPENWVMINSGGSISFEIDKGSEPETDESDEEIEILSEKDTQKSESDNTESEPEADDLSEKKTVESAPVESPQSYSPEPKLAEQNIVESECEAGPSREILQLREECEKLTIQNIHLMQDIAAVKDNGSDLEEKMLKMASKKHGFDTAVRLANDRYGTIVLQQPFLIENNKRVFMRHTATCTARGIVFKLFAYNDELKKYKYCKHADLPDEELGALFGQLSAEVPAGKQVFISGQVSLVPAQFGKTIKHYIKEPYAVLERNRPVKDIKICPLAVLAPKNNGYLSKSGHANIILKFKVLDIRPSYNNIKDLLYKVSKKPGENVTVEVDGHKYVRSKKFLSYNSEWFEEQITANPDQELFCVFNMLYTDYEMLERFMRRKDFIPKQRVASPSSEAEDMKVSELEGLEQINSCTVKQLLVAATKLRVQCVLHDCEMYLMHQSDFSVLQRLQLSKDFGLPLLKTQLTVPMTENPSTIRKYIRSKDFNNLDAELKAEMQACLVDMTPRQGSLGRLKNALVLHNYRLETRIGNIVRGFRDTLQNKWRNFMQTMAEEEAARALRRQEIQEALAERRADTAARKRAAANERAETAARKRAAANERAEPATKERAAVKISAAPEKGADVKKGATVPESSKKGQ